MAVIETSEILLKAVLTRRGRELLYGHNERFIISKFALGDNEINYGLANNSDIDNSDIESLSVFEPSSNPENGLTSRLIRKVDDLEEIIKQKQNQTVPNEEIVIKTQILGSSVFSLENWKNDAATITFSLYHPVNLNYYLSNGFVVDMSAFFKNYTINNSGEGVAFDFFPIFPSTTIGRSNKYWFNASEDYKNKSAQLLNVIIGIDNSHRTTVTDTPLANLVNDLNIPALTFKIKLLETQVRDIYTYMLNKNLSSITDNITIYNNDKDVTPLTNYYGATKNYQSISTTVPITITF